MAKDVVIRISATDAASPTFKRIASEAKSMGAQVTTSANQSARSLDDMQKKATSLGAGIGTLIGGAALAGRAFQSQEQQIRGLNRAYGESSIEIQKFAKELQQSTVYSDDAARQSAQLASTLIRNYGLTADQVELLIARTADLASINVTATGAQFDLVDAVQRTSSAIRGEAESAEALGLTMNDAVVAAEAARRGLVGWTTTMTDAEKAQFRFTLLLEQSTYAQGAAAEAADTNAGKAKQLMNQVQDLTQEFGGALGPMGEYLSVLGDMALAAPLVGAGLGKVAAALGALGGGTTLAGIATLAAASYYAYDLNTNRGGWAEQTTAGLLSGAAGAANWLVPGNPFSDIQKQYQGIISGGDLFNATRSIFGTNGVDTDYQAVLKLKWAGVLPMTFTGNIADAADYINTQSAGTNYTPGQYITATVQAQDYYVQDPVSGQWMAPDVLDVVQQKRNLLKNRGSNTVGASTMGYGALANPVTLAELLGTSRYYGDVSPTGYTGPYQPGPRTYTGPQYAAGASPVYAGDLGIRAGGGPFGGTGFDTAIGGGVDVGGAGLYRDLTQAINEQIAAYYGLASAEEAVARGRSEFKQVQDSILVRESVYSQQIGEFQSQVDAQDAAYEILNKRREEGIELTDRETQFLDNYAKANERGTGAVEDATVSQGLLAQQYLLNMEKGDALNRTMQENADSVGDLVYWIQELILSMLGVPDEVRSRIELERAQEAESRLKSVVDYLNDLDGRSVTFYVNARGDGLGVNLGSPTGIGILPLDGGMDGLTMHSYAGGGTHYGGGNWAIVGERGPEGVWLPNGSQVMNTEGSRSRAGSGGPMFAGPVSITVVANNPHQFATALREYSVGGSRG